MTWTETHKGPLLLEAPSPFGSWHERQICQGRAPSELASPSLDSFGWLVPGETVGDGRGCLRRGLRIGMPAVSINCG